MNTIKVILNIINVFITQVFYINRLFFALTAVKIMRQIGKNISTAGFDEADLLHFLCLLRCVDLSFLSLFHFI